MEMVEITLGLCLTRDSLMHSHCLEGWIKYWFPEFEFSWLAVCTRIHFSCSIIKPFEGGNAHEFAKRNGFRS
jgi:hypothetical protein